MSFDLQHAMKSKNKIKIVPKLPDHVSTLKNPLEKWKLKKTNKQMGPN